MVLSKLNFEPSTAFKLCLELTPKRLIINLAQSTFQENYKIQNSIHEISERTS